MIIVLFVVQAEIALEDAFYNYALSLGKTAVVLCDRGLMDVKVSVPACECECV
jgi:hypothetical protein